MRSDNSTDLWVEESMKKIFLQCNTNLCLGFGHANYLSIINKSNNITLAAHRFAGGLTILAFDGQINNNDVRQLAAQVDVKLDHWLQAGAHG